MRRLGRRRETSVICFRVSPSVQIVFVLIAKPLGFKHLGEGGRNRRSPKGLKFQRRKLRPPWDEESFSTHTVTMAGPF